ncbi:Mgr1p KNAG_0C00370 [Huiozyma naganishii CBS 8797]|uniref:Mitochondrial inner membrane i-AAA protease complex subunit MGR1 n=1 Tax=Huiozyma naganishii (strain ATCC MYA-139 / BCRC 22969 / CBS 8797 / KCTC 17520 / NBRC 10181 / NCYC 3082 / Yp74L-3) TaxID=1071383 RepID=J7S5H4_HUIN7|nr:hypothetical protein KNAG_0C00370 [Kazachstania naganishii CBS 8797]CCK69151.1 hypothetical protein KNAG_0C00370 [Kazachstania naganishii CBS 8797]
MRERPVIRDPSVPPSAQHGMASENNGGNPREVKLDLQHDDDDAGRFYVRPSLGLKLWGPLVPASDNRPALWSLLGVQTAVGIFCLYRFRKFALSARTAAALRRDIADLPTLNRFSVASPGQAFLLEGAEKQAAKSASAAGGPRSGRLPLVRKALWLVLGTALLSQSMLEFCRLKLLKYDPWAEEARTARDKKFFNDIVRFYYEGVDPTKIKVKDPVSGDAISTNLPQVRQSVALVRARAEQLNPVIKWYGPIEFKPMSFGEYLDKIEYFLEMNELLTARKRINAKSLEMLTLLTHSSGEVEEVAQKNAQLRQKIAADQVHIEQRTSELTHALEPQPEREHEESTSLAVPAPAKKIELHGIVLDPETDSHKNVDVAEVWKYYDPWLQLALDTSLSIKFIPTVLYPDTLPEQGRNDESNSEQGS